MKIFVTFTSPVKFTQFGAEQVSLYCYCETLSKQGKMFLLINTDEDFFEVGSDQIKSVTACKY